MATKRPKLFLDTNVCDHLLNPPYVERLPAFLAAIRKTYQISVSPETIIELTRTLKGGNGEFFKHDQKRFRVCVCGHENRAHFMSLPGEFSMKHALGMDVPAKFGADHFRHTARVILSAESRTQLFETGVPKGKYAHTFNNTVNEEQHAEGITAHRSWMKDIMSRQYQYPAPDRLGIGFAKTLGVEIDATQGATLAEGISGYFAYLGKLFEMAFSNPNLNLKRRSGDWVDGQQLLYLSDPNMHFLTGDGYIKLWASASDQSERILDLSNFAKDMGFA